ncbi:Inner membrane protein YdgK [Photorhabdus australis subsp. thailandensis]|uniref:Inner membrane protein YdgK n=1 Tax=Photorhabdus australis subsp. thailandensis TaxID=2805096 RepID=A0A1C0U7X1_9GAMM|nr:DUF2569 domain-containing protein [Photorhabdus australis]OCQ54009.1 Inner membrane protein YdgK [Photorhabdus australis subsp. thailandensis]
MYQTPDYHRINGWILAPAAYLIMTFLSASVMLALYIMTLFSQNNILDVGSNQFTLMWFLSVAITAAMWCFTLWVLKLLFIRSKRFPQTFIIWLIVTVLIALKTFAFSPIPDQMALRALAWPLMAAAIFVPYIKRSHRVKMTFTQDR